MSKWIIRNGLLWENDQLISNNQLTFDVSGDIDREIILENDDLITHGFVDSHCHIWAPSATPKVAVSEAFLPTQGVFYIGDGGTFGYDAWEKANMYWSNGSLSEIKSFLNIRPEGWTKYPVPQPTKASEIDAQRFCSLYEQNRDKFLGIKFALGLSESHDEEIKMLELTRMLADKLNACVQIHLSKSKVSLKELQNYFRPGDILLHPYNGHTGPAYVLNDEGKYDDTLVEMKNNGVLFDASVGKGHFSFDSVFAAIDKGMYPDIISTDENIMAWQQGPFRDLIHLVSCFVSALNMPLEEVLRAVTTTPMKKFGFVEKPKDNLVIYKKKIGDVIYHDFRDDEAHGGFEYKTQAVVLNNKAIFFEQ